MPVLLGVRKRWLLVLRNGSERGFYHTKAFVELLVGDDERNEDANHIVESAGGNGDEAVLVAIFGDSLGFGIRGLACLRVPHQFDGAHAAQATNVADQRPFFLPGQRALFKTFADSRGAREQTVLLYGFDGRERGGA